MRAAQSTTLQLLRDGAGGFDVTWTADLMYDGERRLAGLDIGEPDLTWDLSRFVVASGSVPITWADAFGTSVIPREVGDWFAPFGAELQIDCLIRANRFEDRIPMARLVIESVPEADDRRVLFQGAPVSIGSAFTVNVSDRLAKVKRDEFLVPTAAGSGSAWQEIQAITRFPVIRTAVDATVPTGMAYEGKKDTIVSQLFDLMGAWPHLTGDGVLTGLSKEWGDPVDEIRGYVSAPVSMDSEDTYNAVVVEGKDAAGDPIIATAYVRDGFLRVENGDGGVSPFGVKPYRYPAKFLQTYPECAAYATSLLERVSRLRGVRRTVVEPFNPLREPGDVLTFDGGLVRVVQLRHDGGFTRSVVEVPDQ